MFLTVCTATYNRAHTLDRVYNSLIEQSNKDFEWMVIDDGSTDETEELIDKWTEEDLIKINYYKQENQGMSLAHNKGLSLASGEMISFLDSDDWFYPNTIEEIYKEYQLMKEDEAVIIGLNTIENGEVIGTNFDNITNKRIDYIDLIYKHKMQGDKAEFYKTKILQKYYLPSFKGNKLMPTSYQHYQLSKNYYFKTYNKPLKYVEYQDDGMTSNKYDKYIISADNFSYYRMSIAKLIPDKKRKIINAIQFNATQFLGNVRFSPTDAETKRFFNLFKPLGYLLSVYIKRNSTIKK